MQARVLIVCTSACHMHTCTTEQGRSAGSWQGFQRAVQHSQQAVLACCVGVLRLRWRCSCCAGYLGLVAVAVADGCHAAVHLLGHVGHRGQLVPLLLAVQEAAGGSGGGQLEQCWWAGGLVAWWCGLSYRCCLIDNV